MLQLSNSKHSTGSSMVIVAIRYRENTLSRMIIDSNTYEEITTPKIKNVKNDSEVNNFFEELNSEIKGLKIKKIEPNAPTNFHLYKGAPASESINKKIKDLGKKVSIKIAPFQKGLKQGKGLKRFTSRLFKIFPKLKKAENKIHIRNLWATALHATQKNWQGQLEKLENLFNKN